MPCYDAQFREDRENAVKKVHQLTDMLCRTLKIFDDYIHESNVPMDICEWWQKHKEQDKERK